MILFRNPANRIIGIKITFIMTVVDATLVSTQIEMEFRLRINQYKISWMWIRAQNICVTHGNFPKNILDRRWHLEGLALLEPPNNGRNELSFFILKKWWKASFVISMVCNFFSWTQRKHKHSSFYFISFIYLFIFSLCFNFNFLLYCLYFGFYSLPFHHSSLYTFLFFFYFS